MIPQRILSIFFYLKDGKQMPRNKVIDGALTVEVDHQSQSEFLSWLALSKSKLQVRYKTLKLRQQGKIILTRTKLVKVM